MGGSSVFDRHGHARRNQLPDRMLIKIGHHAQCHAGCQADVQNDLVLDEVFSQALVVDRGDTRARCVRRRD
jgi:hypothetical protein